MVKWIKNTKAFTMTELMIVIFIISILVAIAAPNFMRYYQKGQEKQHVEQVEKKGTHQGIY